MKSLYVGSALGFLAAALGCGGFCAVIGGALGVSGALVDWIDAYGHHRGVYIQVAFHATLSHGWTGCHRHWHFAGADIWHR